MRGLGDAFAVFGGKHVAVDRVAVCELKEELPGLAEADGRDVYFLLNLAYSALERRFAGIETTAGAVDFASAESAFFAD